MPSQQEDGRPARQRANTHSFPFAWRRGRQDNTAATPTPAIVTTPPLQLDELITALTPPAVPSLTYARALAAALGTFNPQRTLPRLTLLNPILASLCSSESPTSLQGAGYDILAAYLEGSGPVILSTSDRLACLSFFLDVPWTQELWECRFKALSALMKPSHQTVSMEGSILRMLATWIRRAFEALVEPDSISHESRLDCQRSVVALTAFLTSLVGRSEFVARLTDDDVSSVLALWQDLIARALQAPGDYLSPSLEPQSSKSISPPKIPGLHRRHYSSSSIQQLHLLKHPADIVVDAFLTYLDTRLVALAPSYLDIILPLLFRSLAFYSTPLPRISLQSTTPKQTPFEEKISEILDRLVTGPYSSSCVRVMKHHFAPSPTPHELGLSIQTTIGAVRTLRISIRRVLVSHLARAYIERATSTEYTPAGVPTHLHLERGLMERAWAKDEAASWDLTRFAPALSRAAKAWIEAEQEANPNAIAAPKEGVLNEIAGILKDVMQALDERGDTDETDDDSVAAVGTVLRELVVYVRLLKTADGGPKIISLDQPTGSSPFLSAIACILAQDLRTSPLFPIIPSIILSAANHFYDRDLAQVVTTMADRQCLSPTSPSWLDDWGNVLSVPGLFAPRFTATRQVAMAHLRSVWEFVKDIPSYRQPLATLVMELWKNRPPDEIEDVQAFIVWNILADEAVFRIVERHAEDVDVYECNLEDGLCDEILLFLIATAQERQEEDDDSASIRTNDTSPPPIVTPANTAAASPVMSRMQSEYPPPKEKETSLPSVMSILSSLTSATPSSRAQSKPRRTTNDMMLPAEPMPPIPSEMPLVPKSVGAVIALISVFSQLVFTPLAFSQCSLWHAKQLFRQLVGLISDAGCVRARLTVLQFMMRLRVDRDHRLYYAAQDADKDGQIATLAALISRADNGSAVTDELMRDDEMRKARARAQERDGRRPSRGRVGPAPRIDSSRSRSRVPHVPPRLSPAVLLRLKPRDPLWNIPETLSFTVASPDAPSEGMTSYNPGDPENVSILPTSIYLLKLVEVMEKEREWEILSYVLCHLPTQLANKHLFCGPKSRVAIAQLLSTLCIGITEMRFGTKVERYPEGIISRDAHGLAYHTLAVLISYKSCFKDAQTQHLLVETFLTGLSGQPSTIKCCLHALSLSAFELPGSMMKHLPRILEKLSQIMSNPVMAVHIIDFLSIVGSHRVLLSNFTEGDYKMVFAVALQYLQLHNRPDVSISWALSQHVRIMSYYIVYLWFLAVGLHDRKNHVSFIVRQLLLANNGSNEVDNPTEVCFDWLARYTYASADPRPANSMLDEIVMNSNLQTTGAEPALSEKTWILGNSVVTIRALARRGWIEVMSRRASGLTKFLVRSENVPMIPLGDVDPDLLAITAILMMDREEDQTEVLLGDTATTPALGGPSLDKVREVIDGSIQPPSDIPRPHPITGYVWSGTAPSQRRKDVVIDPSYLALQLSSYPSRSATGQGRLVTDKAKLNSFLRTFDRMPVIDTHKVGVMYVAPGQQTEEEILRNSHGSPAYARFLEGLGRLINLRGQVDVYHGGLDPDLDGEYAYAWWDDIGQILFHTATLMPNGEDERSTNKKAHIGNDFVRIVWNDSGLPYRFDTLSTQFQFVNIVVEPHSKGAIAAFSNNLHENEYFKVTVQRAQGMTEFTPIGDYKLISAENLPLLVRQIALLSDWFVTVWQQTGNDTRRDEVPTNWRSRLEAIQRFRTQLSAADPPRGAAPEDELTATQRQRDFTTAYS